MLCSSYMLGIDMSGVAGDKKVNIKFWAATNMAADTAAVKVSL